MRILYVVNQMARGGVEIQLRDRAAALVRRGHTVAVVSMMRFLDFEQSLEDAGVETAALGLDDRWSAPRALVRFAGVLRRFRPDVVHSHLFWATLFARTVRVIPPAFRGPWRVLVCSSHAQKEESSSRYVAYRLTSPLGDAWTSVTREGIAVHEAHGAIAPGTARWTPNGVDIGRYRQDDTARTEAREELAVGNAFVWLALGSFRDETKDYSTMLDAMARVSGQSLLLIGGEGRLLEEKRALANRLGIAQRVRFLGLRSDVERLLQAADGYVLSSQTEAMPNVLLQASASALPVVTTDVGEASAIVEDGRGGVVVPRRNPQRLADAMRHVETLDPSTRRRMGEVGRARVAEQFDFDRVVNRWVALYEELLAAKGGVAGE